ncbi:hypothetical protein [Streptomyces bungoensis]
MASQRVQVGRTWARQDVTSRLAESVIQIFNGDDHHQGVNEHTHGLRRQ